MDGTAYCPFGVVAGLIPGSIAAAAVKVVRVVALNQPPKALRLTTNGHLYGSI